MSTPSVSYGRAIDYWLAACFLFLFGAILEFVWVNSIEKRAKKCRENVQRIGAHFTQRLQSSENKHLSLTGKRVGLNAVIDSGCTMAVLDEEADYMKRKAQRIDTICTVMFPLLFVIFNVIYWLIYMRVISWEKFKAALI